MQPRFLDKRVVILEQTVEGLSELPARMENVEAQILHLRGEMRDEFSAIREEMRKGDEETRTFMRMLNEETRSQLRVLAEGVDDTRQQLGSLTDATEALKADVSALKADVSEIKADVSEIKAGLNDVTKGLSAIHAQLARPRRRKPR